MKIILLFVVLAILTSCAKKPPVGFEPYFDPPVYACCDLEDYTDED